MDIPKMPPNSQLKGRDIPLLKNEFRINLLDKKKVSTLWRVDIQVSCNFPISVTVRKFRMFPA